jgi:SAM-dependent methyltransferase
MPSEDAERYWQAVGEENPYWGVLTADAYRADNLTDDAVEALYASGEAHIDFVLGVVRRHLDEHFAPASALDFGCGVGRLVVPLAKRCPAVVGVDVSDGMLRRADERCARLGLANVRLLRDLPPGEAFDLVHSFIVFQHIPCPRGLAIIEELLGRLRDGGVGVLHLTYFNEPPARNSPLRRFARAARRLLRLGSPQMQMNAYDLNPILLALQRAGVRRLHLEYTDHGGCYGVLLFFQKRGDDRYLA